jgi:hypothetical protein
MPLSPIPSTLPTSTYEHLVLEALNEIAASSTINYNPPILDTATFRHLVLNALQYIANNPGGGGGGTVTSIIAGTGLTGGIITTSGTIAVSYGTTAGTAAEGNDARLSNSRTPIAHAGTHAAAGSDPITVTLTSQVTGTLPVANGGTGSTTAPNALTALGAIAKAGDTMTGKLVAAADATISKLNIGNALSGAANPTTTVDGDLWINNGNRLAYKANSSVYSLAPVNSSNSFTAIQSIEVTSASTAFRVTQKGTGEAFRVEDDPTTPDTTPFVISNAGRVGIGVTPDATVALSVDTTGIKFGDGTIQTTASTGGGSITPGIIDNAVLRANGTSGTLLQNSDILIDDAATATQNNVAVVNNHQGQTDSSVVITPKGTGAFILGQKPNGSTGGDARGSYAVDLQLTRSLAGQVATGLQSVCLGANNASSADYAVAIGSDNISSSEGAIGIGQYNSSGGDNSIAIGNSNTLLNFGSIAIGATCESSGSYSAVIGYQSTASGDYSTSIGYRSSADRYGQVAFANGRFAVNGDAQNSRFILRGQSTSTTARNLTLTGLNTTGFLGIPVGKVMAMTINIAGISSLGVVAHYVRQYAVRNLLGTSTQVYAPVTIGTDFASGTSIALSVNDPDDTLRIVVTGTSGLTWKWVATIDAVEIIF